MVAKAAIRFKTRAIGQAPDHRLGQRFLDRAVARFQAMDGPLAVGGPQSGEALGANVGPAALGSLNSSVVTVAIASSGLPTALGPPITDVSPTVEKAYAGSPL